MASASNVIPFPGSNLPTEEAPEQDAALWFRDIEDGLTGGRGGYIRDTVEAKAIRRFLASVGVKAAVRVRRYSMASGLDFGPGYSGRWTDEDAGTIARVFPDLAVRRQYTDLLGARKDGWYVARGLYPHAREDRSDLQADHHDPGGFRVATAHVLALSVILSEEIEKASAKGVW